MFDLRCLASGTCEGENGVYFSLLNLEVERKDERESEFPKKDGFSNNRGKRLRG